MTQKISEVNLDGQGNLSNPVGMSTPANEATTPDKLSNEEQVVNFCSALGHFTGTEKWTRYPTLCPYLVLLTDGALYVAEHGAERQYGVLVDGCHCQLSGRSHADSK